MSDKAEPDRRVRRTQSALLTAFSRLAMEQHLDRIKVADIIREADVGRSTFYDHFSSRDALLLKAMERPEREAALLSIQLAEGQIGLVRAWANGEVSAQPAELAEAICAAARAVLQPGPGVALN